MLISGDGCWIESPGGSQVARIRAADATAAARLDELVRDSTIVREMIAYLEAANVTLMLRSSATLLRDERSGGRSRFFVDKGALIGHVEFDRFLPDPSSQRITLAHELGHAVELAALPRRSTAALGNQLLSHIGQHDPWSPRLVIETPFAHAVDAGVNAELKYGIAPAGTLHRVAQRHNVKLAGCTPEPRKADVDHPGASRPKQ